MKNLQKIFFVLASFLVIINCAVWNQDGKKAFDAFKIKYNLTYPTRAAEAVALNKFVALWRFIQQHNMDYMAGKTEFTLAINKFASLTPAQIETLTTGNKLPPYEFTNFTVRPRNIITVTTDMFPAGPSSVDWNAAGFVTPVKAQGFFCASCWAFSVS